MTNSQLKTITSGNWDTLAMFLALLICGIKPKNEVPENTPDNSLMEDSLEDIVRTLFLSASFIGPQRASALLEHFGPYELLKVVAEGDWDALMACQGIGEKLGKRICIILMQDCRMLASAFERELQGVGCRPMYLKRAADKEQEKFFTIKEDTFDMDEHGLPINHEVKYTRIPTWVHNDSKYMTVGTFDTEGCDLSSAAQADIVRSAAGFMPEEVCDLYDDGKPLKCTDPIVWDLRKQQKRRRIKQFNAWMKWLAQPGLSKQKALLNKGAAQLRKQYFASKDAGKYYMTKEQMNTVTARFKELGQLVWKHQKKAS